jgi:drug/metabolite transporter (DMT)-like permease
MVLARACVEALCALTFIWALGLLPLANITAIVMASPLLIVLLAVLLRIESVGWRRALALTVGFIGVLIVMRPSADGFNAAALVALTGAGFVAIRDLTTRFVGSDVPSTVVSLTATVTVGLLASGMGALETWQSPWRIELAYIAGRCGPGHRGRPQRHHRLPQQPMWASSRAIATPSSPIAVLIGWLVWGETPDAISYAGIALIVGSGLYTLHRQRARPDSQLKPEGDKPL